MFKEASQGYEDHEPVMLQAHIDMVNEKNKESQHNFDTDPLKLYVEDGFLHANETTLGADDGCGVCYMLALLTDNSLSHPALECVFTVQEEFGLCGACLLYTSHHIAFAGFLCVGILISLFFGEYILYFYSYLFI